MAKATAWQSQTKWLTDQRFESSKRHVVGSIWTDRITRRDRASGLTDNELKRRRRGLCDGYGHLPPLTKRDAAIVAVERAMNALPAAVRDAITPRQKWDAVDRLCR